MTKQIKFLSWNTNGKHGSTETILESIIGQHGSFDFILLNECKLPLSSLFCTTHGLTEFLIHNAETERLKQRVYIKSSGGLKLSHLNNIVDKDEEERIVSTTISGLLIERTISHLARAVLLEVEVNTEKYLIACVHLPGKRNLDEISQLQANSNYKRYILERAAQYDDRVIIAGDFNMNPFDAGMIEPMGFFAVNHREFVKNKREFQHTIEMMFYNPCWSLLGDHDEQSKDVKVSGTHFFTGSPSKKLYWHLFDQVIVSEKMISRFVNDELKIIEPDEIVNELVKEHPKREDAKYSDHLPLKFTLKL